MRTDVKKPTGSSNFTAGGTDTPIVSGTPSTSKKLLALHTAIQNAALRFWFATPSTWKRGTIRTKAKAPARKNAFGQAVATPTDKRGFVIPKFWGLVRLHLSRMVYGHGGGYPQGHPRGLSRVLNRHAHPLRVRTQRVVLKSRQGATMHPTTSASVRVTTPTTGKSHQFDPIQLHVDAVNACAMASYYTRKGNHAGAARKAVQAVSALRKLAAFERQGVAA